MYFSTVYVFMYFIREETKAPYSFVLQPHTFVRYGENCKIQCYEVVY